MSASAYAIDVPAFSGLNPCSAVTILAPTPVVLTPTPPAPPAGGTSDPAVVAALAAAAKAALATAPFRSPKPSLQPGAAAEWDDVITLTFASVDDSRLAKCLEAGDLTLFLDHHALTGLPAIERAGNGGKNVTIRYRLTRPSNLGSGWNELMTEAWAAGGAFYVTVGIGTGGNEFAYADDRLRLTLGAGDTYWAQWALVGSIVLLAVTWRFSKLLQGRQTGQMTYSISRMLLGCWVLTTMSAVWLLFLRTGDMPSASEGGLAFMLGISGATTGLSALIDMIKKPHSDDKTRFWQDFLDDADGLALHRVQVALFNGLVLFIVWRDMIHLGTVALIDKGWVNLLGASALTFVFGKTSESTQPTIQSQPTSPVAQSPGAAKQEATKPSILDVDLVSAAKRSFQRRWHKA